MNFWRSIDRPNELIFFCPVQVPLTDKAKKKPGGKQSNVSLSQGRGSSSLLIPIDELNAWSPASDWDLMEVVVGVIVLFPRLCELGGGDAKGTDKKKDTAAVASLESYQRCWYQPHRQLSRPQSRLFEHVTAITRQWELDQWNGTKHSNLHRKGIFCENKKK